MLDRDTVWERSDGVRIKMSVRPGVKASLDHNGYEQSRSATMTLTPFGGKDDGAMGETFVLIGSAPIGVS